MKNLISLAAARYPRQKRRLVPFASRLNDRESGKAFLQRVASFKRTTARSPSARHGYARGNFLSRKLRGHCKGLKTFFFEVGDH